MMPPRPVIAAAQAIARDCQAIEGWQTLRYGSLRIQYWIGDTVENYPS
jgi:hypothetical protein